MPKPANSPMPPLKQQPPLRPPSRQIQHQTAPPDGPHRNPEKHARKAAGGDGKINPAQQKY